LFRGNITSLQDAVAKLLSGTTPAAPRARFGTLAKQIEAARLGFAFRSKVSPLNDLEPFRQLGMLGVQLVTPFDPHGPALGVEKSGFTTALSISVSYREDTASAYAEPMHKTDYFFVGLSPPLQPWQF
jgi:hypothetical protein